MESRVKLSGRPAEPNRARVIDMTPTWSAIMPALAAVIAAGPSDGSELATAELMRLAKMADGFGPGAAKAATAATDDTARNLRTWAGIKVQESNHARPGSAVRVELMAKAAAFYDSAASISADEQTRAELAAKSDELCKAAHWAAVTLDSRMAELLADFSQVRARLNVAEQESRIARAELLTERGRLESAIGEAAAVLATVTTESERTVTLSAIFKTAAILAAQNINEGV